MRPRPFVVVTAALMLSWEPVAWGGTKLEDIADRVEAVLQQELTADIPDRTALLPAISGNLSRSRAAHWAGGDVLERGTWLPFDARAADAQQDERLREYIQRRDSQPLTVDRHLELAGWCRDQGLRDQERAHLIAVLDAGIDQPALWKRLGCRRLNGLWFDERQFAAYERVQQESLQNLRRWRARATALAKRLADPNPGISADARAALNQIHDRTAIPALEVILTSHSAELSADFLQWVRRLPDVEATFALTRQAVTSPWSGPRAVAIDALRSRRLEHFVPLLLDSLVVASDQDYDVSAQRLMRTKQPVIVQTFRAEFRGYVVAMHQAVQVAPQRTEIVEFSNPMARFGGEWATLRRNQLERQSLDFHRRVDDSLAAAHRRSDELAAQVAESNARVMTVLSAVTETHDPQTPEEWWDWWTQATDRSSPPEAEQKRIVEVGETETIYQPPISIFIPTEPSCLPAGTPVYTELGPAPIENIRRGDRVLAKDINTGELAYRAVLGTTIRQPQPLVKLSLADETIESTRGHHFWVSGKGWRMAREIQPGDRLHGVRGTARVTDVSTGSMAEVYNLVVDRANTYFVGDSLVLSHDVTFPEPTNIKVPGLEAK